MRNLPRSSAEPRDVVAGSQDISDGAKEEVLQRRLYAPRQQKYRDLLVTAVTEDYNKIDILIHSLPNETEMTKPLPRYPARATY